MSLISVDILQNPLGYRLTKDLRRPPPVAVDQRDDPVGGEVVKPRYRPRADVGLHGTRVVCDADRSRETTDIFPHPEHPLNRVNMDASTGFTIDSGLYLTIQAFPSWSRRTALSVPPPAARDV